MLKTLLRIISGFEALRHSADEHSGSEPQVEVAMDERTEAFIDSLLRPRLSASHSRPADSVVKEESQEGEDEDQAMVSVELRSEDVEAPLEPMQPSGDPTQRLLRCRLCDVVVRRYDVNTHVRRYLWLHSGSFMYKSWKGLRFQSAHAVGAAVQLQPLLLRQRQEGATARPSEEPSSGPAPQSRRHDVRKTSSSL